MSYPNRTAYLDRGNCTHADVQKCAPPPDWTQEDEQAHSMAWRRRHVSNPSSEDRVAAWVAQARIEADRLPGAEYWREVFGC